MSVIPLVNVLSSFRCHPQSIIHQFRISIHHFSPQLDVPKSVLSSGLTHPVVRNYSHLTHLLYLPTPSSNAVHPSPFSSSMPSCQSRSLSCSLLFSASSNFQFAVYLIPSVPCILLPLDTSQHLLLVSPSLFHSTLLPVLLHTPSNCLHAPSSSTACSFNCTACSFQFHCMPHSYVLVHCMPFLIALHAPSSFTACPLQLHYMLTQHDLFSFTKSSFQIQ